MSIEINSKNRGLDRLKDASSSLANKALTIVLLEIVDLKLKCGWHYGVIEELELAIKSKSKLWKYILLEVQAKNRENWDTFNSNYQQFEVGELRSIDLSENPKLFKLLCRFWESFLNEFKKHLVQNLNINIQDGLLDCRIFDHALTSDYNYPKYGRFAKVGREVLENNRAELDFFIQFYKSSRSELQDILQNNNIHLSCNLVLPQSCFDVDLFNIIVSCIPGDKNNYDQNFYCSMEQIQELHRLMIQILDSFVNELESLHYKVEFKPQNLCSKIFKI